AQPAFEGTSPHFAVAVLGLPFTLQTEGELTVPYGTSKSKVKVSVQRRDYKGPVALQLQGLPAQVGAAQITLADNENSGEFDIDFPNNAPASKNKVIVVGTATAAVNRQASSPGFLMNIAGPPFDLRLEPNPLTIAQGSPSSPWKVTVVRHGYDGSIKVE